MLVGCALTLALAVAAAPGALGVGLDFSSAGAPLALPGRGLNAEFASDGRTLLVGSERLGSSHITAFAISHGRARRLPGAVSGPTGMRLGPLAPDGKFAVVCSEGTHHPVVVYRLSHRGIGKAVSRGHAENIYCEGAISPDSRVLAFDGLNLATFTIGATGVVRHVPGTPPWGSAFEKAAFSPMGGLIATTRPPLLKPRGSVAMYSLDASGAPGPKPISEVPAGVAMESLAFSPSGDLLAALSSRSSTDGSVNPEGPSIWMFTVDPTGLLTRVAGTPAPTVGDGDGEVSVSYDGTVLAANDESSGRVQFDSVGPGGTLGRVAILGSPRIDGAADVVFSPTEPLVAVVGRRSVVLLAYHP